MKVMCIPRLMDAVTIRDILPLRLQMQGEHLLAEWECSCKGRMCQMLRKLFYAVKDV